MTDAIGGDGTSRRERFDVVPREPPRSAGDVAELTLDPALRDALIRRLPYAPATLGPEALANPALLERAPEKLRARDEAMKGELYAELARIGDRRGCRADDTVDSLIVRRQALLAETIAARATHDAEAPAMGLDGYAGKGEAVDWYEVSQWVAAANPGSVAGSAMATHAAMRGGSIHDVRAAGQLGNALEGMLVGAAKAAPKTEPAREVDEFNEGGKYKTAALLPRYATETQRYNRLWGTDKLGRPHDWKTERLSSVEARAPYKLEVREVVVAGRVERRLFDANGRPFDSRAANTARMERSGVPRAIFVMNARGELFASDYQAKGHFHHSTLASGAPVAAAGEMLVVEGRIVEINNMSGHYWPSHEHTIQAIDALMRSGMDMRGVVVTDVTKPKTEDATDGARQ
jgi:hypothetical protein